MKGFNFQLDTVQCAEVAKKELTLIPLTPPSGEHKGTQSGYEVRFVADGHEYVATSLCGVRGINEPVTVVVSDKGIYLK